jgi:hypothetical protein
MERLLRRIAVASLYRAARKERGVMEVTEEMRNAFHSKAEVLPTGTMLHLDEAIRAALSAAPAPEVKVKPLEWVKHPTANGWRAETILGTHQVWSINCVSWQFDGWSGDRLLEKAETVDAAKAAAQADYTTRIMSALEVPQVKETAEAHVSSANIADMIRRGIKDQGYGYTLKGDKLTVSSDEVFAIDIAKLADFIRAAIATEVKS